MLAIDKYSPLVYANLPDFFQAREMLKYCSEAIATLGSIISRHRFQDYFGVSLLHKHFNLYNDEALFRTVAENHIHIAPMRRDCCEGAPFIWAYAKENTFAPYKLYPIEFIDKRCAPTWIEAANNELRRNSAFVEDYFRVLQDIGLANYLGLGLIPNRLFKMSPNHTLAESDNHKTRHLVLEIVPSDSLRQKDSTQTLWVF